MGKKKKQYSRIKPLDIHQGIQQSLLVDFGCSEDEISLIEHALRRSAPPEITEQIAKIMDGDVSLPVRRPSLTVAMSDGTTRHVRLKNHPFILLLDYLKEQYSYPFVILYWLALTTPSPQNFYTVLKALKEDPHFKDELQTLLLDCIPSPDTGHPLQTDS